MAAFSNLNREERIGLGIAAGAHAALAVALIVAANKQPAQVPVPERMTVSLADEVSLESTAPDPSAQPQAAVAPVLAPEPAPEPEPVSEPERQVERTVTPPQPRPSVAPRATPTPQPRATQQPRREQPRPQPTTQPRTERSGGSRLGSDFLEGSSAGERSESRGTPAATFGAAERASLSQAINRQLKPHWNAPQGVDAELLVTVLTWELNPDGSLSGRPRVVSQSGINDSNRPQAALHAERAIRAVQLAAPFDLPDQFYDKWKLVREWRFDRKL